MCSLQEGAQGAWARLARISSTVGLQPYVPPGGSTTAPQRYARRAYLRGEHREYAEAEERAAVCEERALAGHDVSLHQVEALLRAAAEGTAGRGMLGLARQDARQQRAECEARHLAEGVPH